VSTTFITSGTYSPTFTSTANLDSTPVQVATFSYLRVGNVVRVAGAVTVDPTAAAPTDTQFRFTLPIASNFSSAGQLAGNGGRDQDGTAVWILRGDTVNDAADAFCDGPGNATSSILYVDFQYQVI
jgi:hypothetical protein